MLQPGLASVVRGLSRAYPPGPSRSAPVINRHRWEHARRICQGDRARCHDARTRHTGHRGREGGHHLLSARPSRVSDGTGQGMSLDVEGSQPAVPSTGNEQLRRDDAEQVVLLDGDRPARRRRSALVGGGVLVAASPVAVAAGLLVPGFAALGLGALLLLLPPRVRRNRKHRSLRVVRTPAAAVGRGVVALGRGSARVGARIFKAVDDFAANEGRDGVVRIGRASAGAAAAVGRATSVGASRGWSAAQLIALRVGRGLVVATRSLAREARSTSIRAWERCRPMLRRAWAACLAGSRRAVHELAALARSASERLSPLVDSRSGARQIGSLPPRAPRRPPARAAPEPVRRSPALRPGSRTRSGRSRGSPPSSR
jgi:hypothetical protein